jgi:hypothetical protein
MRNWGFGTYKYLLPEYGLSVLRLLKVLDTLLYMEPAVFDFLLLPSQRLINVTHQ